MNRRKRGEEIAGKIKGIIPSLILLSGLATAQIDWLTTLNLQSEGVLLELAIGGSLNATDGFDTGLDILAPPPPPDGFYAYLEIDDPTFSSLYHDIRYWDASTANAEWQLWVVRFGGARKESVIVVFVIRV